MLAKDREEPLRSHAYPVKSPLVTVLAGRWMCDIIRRKAAEVAGSGRIDPQTAPGSQNAVSSRLRFANSCKIISQNSEKPKNKSEE